MDSKIKKSVIKILNFSTFLQIQAPNYIIMEQQVNVKDVKILETVEDIQERREQVLKKYVEFKEAARSKREMLEDSRRFQYFRRDADELVSKKGLS